MTLWSLPILSLNLNLPIRLFYSGPMTSMWPLIKALISLMLWELFLITISFFHPQIDCVVKAYLLMPMTIWFKILVYWNRFSINILELSLTKNFHLIWIPLLKFDQGLNALGSNVSLLEKRQFFFNLIFLVKDISLLLACAYLVTQEMSLVS